MDSLSVPYQKHWVAWSSHQLAAAAQLDSKLDNCPTSTLQRIQHQLERVAAESMVLWAELEELRQQATVACQCPEDGQDDS